MKVPYTWLQELVEVNVPIEHLAESLSIAGFEVEAIEDYSTRANGVVVGYIESTEKHPHADKLSVCKVNIGKKISSQIVCGASNVRIGTHVIVAPPGASLSAKNLNIKVSKIRGIESSGMICSLGELGYETDEKGIAILEDLDIAIPNIGSIILDLFGLNEKILDLAITANRPDGMSILGIAREVSALTESKLMIPVSKTKQITNKITHPQIDRDSIGKSGLYTLTILENIDGSIKSPNWIQERLFKCGIKSINAIVDITNYIMLEQGQPLHVFDLDKLEKITSKKVDQNSFRVRKGKLNEQITALDNQVYNLNPDITIITCHEIPVAIAGVIGGFDSSVTNGTNRVILEAALFTPKSVRRTSRNIGLRTESSSRYEKGITSQLVLHSINRYIDILKQLFNPSISNTWIDKDIDNIKPEIILRRDRIHKILGPIIDNLRSNQNTDINSVNEEVKSPQYITDKEIKVKLNLLGCKCKDNNQGWIVTIPPYRSIDLLREIDLIEEIARLIGYDKFESNLPQPIKPGGLNSSQLAERKLRQYFAGSGFQELTTFSLVPNSLERDNRIAISNPLLTDTSHLRTNLWEEHLNITHNNITSGQTGCWIYEIGRLYTKTNNVITEKLTLGGVITGVRQYGKWLENAKNDKITYYEARGLLHQSTSPLDIQITDKPLLQHHLLHPGRAASLYLEGKIIGIFGQIHPSKAENFNVAEETYVFQLDLDPIISAAIRTNSWCPKFKVYSTVPYMERDLAIVVDKKITSDQITSLIKKAGKPLLENVQLIDRYEGNNLPVGKISQAFRIRYRDSKRTLKESDINPIHQRIREVLTSKLGAELRS